MANHRELDRLTAYPREDLDCELKGWLNLAERRSAATIAKACLALANHGGGYLLVGFEEQAGAWTATASEMVERYTQDDINGFVSRYADPVFHIEVHHIVHATAGSTHPVLIVPGGHRVPIRCRSACENVLAENAYYIRRPGPSSEPPRTTEEWNALIRRCVLNDREALLRQLTAALAPPAVAPAVEVVPPRHEAWIAKAEKRFQAVQQATYGSLDANPLRHGTWMAAFTMDVREPGLSLRAFRERLYRCVGRETGWPIGLFMERENSRPYATDGLIEAWLGERQSKEAGHSDFWRASPQGEFATFRGYQDDDIANEGRAPGECLNWLVFVWRVGELLLYLDRFAKEFAEAGSAAQVTMRWTGLRGRRLVNTSSEYHLADIYRCHDDVVETSLRIANGTVDANMSELVGELTRPLFDAFDFFELSKTIRDAELQKLLRRR